MNVFTGEMSAEQTRMNELYTTLKAWSDAYYNDDAPLATDEEYDRLMRELKQLEAEPILLEPWDPMGSLAKCK